MASVPKVPLKQGLKSGSFLGFLKREMYHSKVTTLECPSPFGKERYMTDTYTKVCLTVIAVSLAIIGFRGLPMVEPAYAQGDKVHKIAIPAMETASVSPVST
jgi:hypothetical protein